MELSDYYCLKCFKKILDRNILYTVEGNKIELCQHQHIKTNRITPN